jgi:hypothetical protein
MNVTFGEIVKPLELYVLLVPWFPGGGNAKSIKPVLLLRKSKLLGKSVI